MVHQVAFEVVHPVLGEQDQLLAVRMKVVVHLLVGLWCNCGVIF